MTISLQRVKSRFNEYLMPRSLESMSAGAFESFEHMGLPDRRNENWKYTNVNSLLSTDLHFASAASELSVKSSNKFEFLNGHLVGAQTIEGAVWRSLGAGTLTEEDIRHIASSLQPEDGFEALSLSAPSEILIIEVPAGQQVEEVLTLESVYNSLKEESVFQPLVFIQVGQGAELHLHEVVKGQSSGLVNGLTRLELGKGARVHHVKEITASDSHRNVAGLDIYQARDSFMQSSCFTCGGKVLRHSVTVHQMGTGSETVCNGLYLTKGKEHADFRINIRHLKPHGISRQLYKGVLKDSSRAIFNGKIYIEKGAQKTDSSQLNNNLILSRNAEADSKPELEVYADDVKANHGSAIGQLDQDQLFYLMSRAISQEEAIKILARGFVEEVALKVESKKLRNFAHSWLEDSLVDFQQSLEQSKGFAR